MGDPVRLLGLIDTLRAIAENHGDLRVFILDTRNEQWEDAEVELRRERRFLELPDGLEKDEWWVSVGPC
jgi:hypothetical protein